jgi:hypothetical protein
MKEQRVRQAWVPLCLTNCDNIAVDQRIYPMLMEWEWAYDDATQQAVRADGSGIRLYDEQIRLLASSEVIMHAVLDRSAIRVMFGGLPAYSALIRLSTRQREPVLFDLSMTLPNISLVLAGALSEILALYHRWLIAPTRLVYHRDPTNLTPGSFETVEGNPAYETLGQWMLAEVTGNWLPDHESPTGLLPEPKYMEAMKLATKEWRLAARATNGSKTAHKQIETLLRAEDLPVWLLVQHAIEVIENYKL